MKRIELLELQLPIERAFGVSQNKLVLHSTALTSSGKVSDGVTTRRHSLKFDIEGDTIKLFNIQLWLVGIGASQLLLEFSTGSNKSICFCILNMSKSTSSLQHLPVYKGSPRPFILGRRDLMAPLGQCTLSLRVSEELRSVS